MKVLITGVSGFIGSHLVDRLEKEDFELTGLIRNSSNLRWLSNKNIRLLEADFYDLENLEKALKSIDVVIHIAGRTSANNDKEYYQANVEATENLIKAALKNNVKKFIYISSQTAVGPAKEITAPSNEESDLQPITAYGRSKKAAEELFFNKYSELPYVILRPPAVFGERDSAVLTVFQSIKFGIAPIIGFNDKYVSLIYVKNLVEGIYDAITKSKTGEVYFISSDTFYKWADVIDLISKTMNKKALKLRIPEFLIMPIAGISEILGKLSPKPPVFNYDKGKDLTQELWICSNLKSKKELEYKEIFSLEQGITNTYNWYIDNKWL